MASVAAVGTDRPAEEDDSVLEYEKAPVAELGLPVVFEVEAEVHEKRVLGRLT